MNGTNRDLSCWDSVPVRKPKSNVYGLDNTAVNGQYGSCDPSHTFQIMQGGVSIMSTRTRGPLAFCGHTDHSFVMSLIQHEA